MASSTPETGKAAGQSRRFGIPGRYLVISAPYVWLLLFFLAPFAIVFNISFSSAIIAQPPYTALFDWSTGLIPQIRGTLSGYGFLLSDELYAVAYLNSIKIALVSTMLCLMIGYPMAYGIARAPAARRNTLLMLVILPFWTSFLIRVYAWIGILKNNGVLNNALISLGLIDEPLPMMHNAFSVYVGIVYSYLPFMILPLYANLAKMDESLLEAAADLGCRPWKAFLFITLPLSFPGIIAGSMLVFIPAVGEFVIPALLGGPDTLMIGKVLWNEFFHNRDWPVASAVAIAMLVLLVAPIVIFQHYQAREDDN
ncbi:MAG: Putrescine transport system permease protein PotH [Gammaproteobacteria bacterium]|nr:Putrescine transport system permease protein PotH [Gammaproteobacteria bacterium]